MQATTNNMEEDKTHQRNESVYSMDSFVADFPSRDGEKTPSPEKSRSQTYISPSNSQVTTPPAANNNNNNNNNNQHHRNLSLQDTIDSLPVFSHETPIPRHAPNPFFSPSYYADDNSEVSDGSFILHEIPAMPVLQQQQQQQQQNKPPQQIVSQRSLQPQPQHAHKRGHSRDRFPSFDDSVGSTNSIHYVPKQQQPKPTVTKSATPNAPLTAQQIQQLPYHERRKLLAQRREQKQQQQQQQSSGRTDMSPHGMQQTHSTSRVDPRVMQQQQQQMYPPPYVMPPPEMYYPNSPLMMQHPLHPLPGQQQSPMQQQQQALPYGRPPFQGVPPPPVGPPGAYGNYPGMPFYPMNPGYAVPPPQQQQQQLRPGMQQQSPRSSSNNNNNGKEYLQTTGLPRGYTGREGHSTIGRTRSSSLDSSDGNDKKRSTPPPPPPPPAPHHVRTDSSGSVSSFGSLDRSSSNHRDEEVDAKKQPPPKSFLEQLNPWAPKAPNVDDYHRNNQAFLKKANRERERQRTPSPSPKQEVRRNKPLGSMDRPPPSRGTHKRLPSIDNDDWEETEEGKNAIQASTQPPPSRAHQRTYSSGEDSGYGEDRPRSRVPPRFQNKDNEPDETSTLLPPPGISSNEQYDKLYMDQSSRGAPDMYGSVATVRMDNATPGAQAQLDYDNEQTKRSRKKKKKGKSRSRRSRQEAEEPSDSPSSSSASSQDYHLWMKQRSRMLEKERIKLIKKWREEARAEEATARKVAEENQLHKRCSRYLHSRFGNWYEESFKFLTWSEAFVANVPLTINAIALAMANLGVVWFKFAEENMQSCEPVHYHSSQCTFPEFPGCFYCDTEARMYKVAVNFHWGCSTIAGILASIFICKLIIAPRVVFDELGSPTTAAPAGLFCMTLDIVFAGRGMIGQIVVSTASFIHLCLAVWFIYMALAYHIMPEPSWFPNTSSIGISAVKTWLYYPMAGHFLMAISLSLNFFFFPISLIRVALNRKISATVGWMQMSAPNVSLYALTLMAQPSFEEEHPDITKFQVVHRLVYLPCMHVLFGLCILGMCASLHSLFVRWKEFRKLPFSPAHAAFCVPTLSHANAVQAYRAAVNSFSDIPAGSPFKICLYVYWVIVLAGGTIVTLWIGAKFLSRLPEWTHIDTEGEIEPPAPYDTSMTASNLITTGETLVQPFVSPAILQANETGTLVLARNRQGDQVYRRTRKVTALGFEPIMSELQMDVERDLLLDWVSRNPPRRRHQTLSVPGIDFSYGEDPFGTGNTGVYSAEQSAAQWARHQRSTTTSPYTLLGRKATTPQPRYR